MGAPAMGVGQFLAAALGTMAVGGLSGMAQHKIQADTDAKKFTMQLLQRGIFDKMMAGEDIPLDAVVQGLGGDKKQAEGIYPIIQNFVMGAKRRSAEARGRVFVGGGYAVPSLAAAPSAAPQTGNILSTMAGGSPFEQLPQEAAPTAEPEPGALSPGMPQPGVKSFSEPMPGGGTVTYGPSDELRKAAVMKWQATTGVSPKAVMDRLAKLGLPMLSQAEYTQLGEKWTSDHLPAALARATEGGASGPEAMQQAFIRLYAESGYLPEQYKAQAVPDQASRDAWAARLLTTQGRGVPLAKFWDALATLGIPISDGERKRQLEASTADLMQRLVAERPDLANNPDAMAFAVAQAQGFAGQTAESMRAMSQPAPMEPAAAAELTRMNRPPVLTRQLGGPAAAPGQEARLAKETAASAAVRETEQQATAREVGKAKGEETGKGITTIDEYQQLNKYVNPSTGHIPPPGMTRQQLNAKIADGTYGTLNVPLEEYMGYRQFMDVANSYNKILDRPGNIFSRPVGKRVLGRFASGPWGFHVPGFGEKWQFPPITVLRDELKLSKQDIADVQQLVTLQNTAVAHLRSLGEKGQGVSSKLFEMGMTSFPGFIDDEASARAKVTALNLVIGLRLQSAVTMSGGPTTTGAPIMYKGWTITPKGR